MLNKNKENNKLNYKLVNVALLTLIAFLVYLSGNFWIRVLKIIIKIFLPFLFAFAIAYALYPFLEKMRRKGLPKWLGVSIIMVSIIALISLIIYLITTVMVGQIGGLFTNIVEFLDSLKNSNSTIHIAGFETSIESVLKEVFSNVSSHVQNGAISFINVSLSYIANLFMVIAGFIYFLIDMDKIINKV